MCACEPSFTCAACSDSHRDDRYPELPDAADDRPAPEPTETKENR